MLFPIFETTREQYRENLLVQLADPACIIFFDTNLFSQLFKLYSGARNEFYTWFTSVPIKDRVKITNWSMQEYNNRAINKKLDDYLDGVQVLDTVKKHLNNSVNFLQMFYDREITKGSYASKEDFMNDVQTVKSTFAKITDSVKLHENTVNKLNSEFSQHLQYAVINSNIYAILANIQHEAEFRFQNNMPPGYKDDSKGSNKYGDLIIWKEILGYCRDHSVKNLIFVSNDGKKDLVYHPFVSKPGGKKTTESDVRFPDPRLFDEFRTASNGEKFSIISFATLISLLQENSRTSFLEISTAIQLAVRPTVVNNETSQPSSEDIQGTAKSDLMVEKLTVETDHNEVEAINSEVANEAPLESQKSESLTEAEPSVQEPLVEVINETEKINEPNLDSFIIRPDLPYDQTALADELFIDPGNTLVTGLIDELASYDWYRQNDAILQLWRVNTRNISNKDVLFVLGRRIYSAACGNAFEAIRYLETFASEVPTRSIFFVQQVANGIFYEIYFDHSNRLRKNRYKDNFIEIVFGWQTIKDLAPCVEFINHALEPYRAYLLITPSTNPKKLQVELTTEMREEYARAIEFVVSEITINGRQITKEKIEEENPFFPEFTDNDFHEATEEKLLSKISYKIAVPPSQLSIHLPAGIPQGKFPVYTLKHNKKIEL